MRLRLTSSGRFQGVAWIGFKIWQDSVRHEIEMMRFAKEMGVVGRDQIDQRGKFRLAVARGQQLAIVLESAQAQLSAALCQAPDDQVVLLCAKMDPAVAIDDPRNLFVGRVQNLIQGHIRRPEPFRRILSGGLYFGFCDPIAIASRSHRCQNKCHAAIAHDGGPRHGCLPLEGWTQIFYDDLAFADQRINDDAALDRARFTKITIPSVASGWR